MKSVKETFELGVFVERQDMGDKLVRPHDHDAATSPIDAPQVEDVGAALQVRAEHLLIVREPVATLPRQQEGGHGIELKIAVSLLEDRPDVDDKVDVGAGRRVFSHRGMRGTGKKSAQGPEPRGGACRVLGVGEREQPEAAVRLDDMPQLDGPGVSEADDRRGMKAHADREPFGEAPPGRLPGQDRRAIAGGRSRCEARLLHEIRLELRGIDPFAVRLGGVFRRSAEHSRPLAVEVDQLLGDGLALARVGAQNLRPTRRRRTAASFHPRLNASCMETFMPCPAFGLWVWQASPAMKTRGRSFLRRVLRQVVELVAEPLADLIHRPPGDLLHVQRIGTENALRRCDQMIARDP